MKRIKSMIHELVGECPAKLFQIGIGLIMAGFLLNGAVVLLAIRSKEIKVLGAIVFGFACMAYGAFYLIGTKKGWIIAREMECVSLSDNKLADTTKVVFYDPTTGDEQRASYRRGKCPFVIGLRYILYTSRNTTDGILSWSTVGGDLLEEA